MQPIISPVSRELLKAELTPARRLRTTNKSNNEIYVVTYQNAPNVLREIGRLREIAFRTAGGGTGRELDLDEFDTCEGCYYQLIVWCPETEEILGGYRFLPGLECKFREDGQPHLATSHMFRFSQEFIRDYLATTVELGRSFVTLEYQSSQRNYKSLFALDNLWDGLGALTVVIPGVRYFFGKMTMYPSFNRASRDMILYFLNKHFGDKEALVRPITPATIGTPEAQLAAMFDKPNFKDDYFTLNTEVRKLGYNIPPLINAYMGLSPTMRVFGTAVNEDFGQVEETGILIAFDEILEEKRMRHIETFVRRHPESMEIMRNVFLKEHTDA
ncbi:MAG: GNAT family N-acetyltransferase [Bacteroidaceae bacterium]|nr:GNAT family N-acetyltransferase [Bacteroidaceae bacterium]